MSPFCKQLWKSKRGIQAFAKAQKPKALNQQELLDELLLALWDALHLDLAIEWSAAGVANVPSRLAFGMGRYFMKGLDVAADPVFTGICGNCANLLYGQETDNGSLSIAKRGPPVTKDGIILGQDKS